MTRETEAILVVAPTMSFEHIAATLASMGWRRGRQRPVAPPLIPGEPEFASWSALNSRTHVTYTFNPVVKFRVLSFSGVGAARAARAAGRGIPALGSPQIRQLLRSSDVKEILLGVFAASELQDVAVLDAIARLRSHSNCAVANAASTSLEKLSRFLIEAGSRALVEEQTRHPDRSAIFPRLGGGHERRQVLRWLLHDRAQANDDIERTLRAALGDEDWEVRATAMLVAARYRLSSLWQDIRCMTLPKTTRKGPVSGDREILVALRKAVLAHLQGEPVRQHPRSAPGNTPCDREEMWQHLRLCVAGGAVDYHDRVFLLTHALTTPLDLEGPPPGELPTSLVEDNGSYTLRRSGMSFRWVPPIPHWLGSGDPDLHHVNPIGLFHPSGGFFVAERLLTQDVAEWIGAPTLRSVPTSGDATQARPLLASYEAASRLCDQVGHIEQLVVTLPSAAQWEVAARGPDGRRHPWGNGFEGDPAATRSPWGVAQLFDEGQWTTTTRADKRHIIMGKDKQLRCAAGHVAANGGGVAQYAVRFTISD